MARESLSFYTKTVVLLSQFLFFLLRFFCGFLVTFSFTFTFCGTAAEIPVRVRSYCTGLWLQSVTPWEISVINGTKVQIRLACPTKCLCRNLRSSATGRGPWKSALPQVPAERLQFGNDVMIKAEFYIHFDVCFLLFLPPERGANDRMTLVIFTTFFRSISTTSRPVPLPPLSLLNGIKDEIRTL